MKTALCNQVKPLVIALLCFAFTSLMTQPVLAEDTSTNDWDLSASFYLWAPDIKGKTDGDDVVISLSDIIEDLDMLYNGDLRRTEGPVVFPDRYHLHGS